MNSLINSFISHLLDWSAIYLMPVMMLTFFGALVARMVVYVLLKSENRFTLEFEKRVYQHRDGNFAETRGLEYHRCVEYLLSKTCNETYVLPATKRARKGDAVLTLSNRIFMIQDGAYRLSKATIENLQFCTKGSTPDFEIVAAQAFARNLYFNKLFGLIPVDLIDETLTILPGIMVVLGIFGTFVGIMQGLPMLKGIDPTNTATTGKVLNDFLGSMAYSIGTSVFGVFLSVILTAVNTWTSWRDLCVGLVERYRNALHFLWMEREASGALAVTPAELDATAASPEFGNFALMTVAGRQAEMTRHAENPPVVAVVPEVEAPAAAAEEPEVAEDENKAA
jgi:hypothetical protein